MVGIIILNYNNSHCTIQCIESIIGFNTALVRIVVVDNSSTDDSLSVLENYLLEHRNAFELIQAKYNGGYAQGNNVGLNYLDKDPEIDKILILNNDVLFTQDMLPRLSEFLDSHPEAGVVSPLLYCRDGKTIDYACARKDCTIREIVWTYLLYFTDICGILSRFSNRRKLLLKNPDLLNASEVEIELPSGACFMIRKELFRKIGYFDPNTFLYYEENILYRKLLKEGKKNYMLPGVSCIHLGGETTNKVAHSASYMKTSKASGYYYTTHYRNLTLLQKGCLLCARYVFDTMVDIVKFVKEHYNCSLITCNENR